MFIFYLPDAIKDLCSRHPFQEKDLVWPSVELINQYPSTGTCQLKSDYNGKFGKMKIFFLVLTNNNNNDDDDDTVID